MKWNTKVRWVNDGSKCVHLVPFPSGHEGHLISVSQLIGHFLSLPTLVGMEILFTENHAASKSD